MYTFLRSHPLAFTSAFTSLCAKKSVSLSSVPLSHLSGDRLCGYNLVLQLGEFLAPPLPKITVFSIIAVT